ncbi:hypothetical protein WJR50_22735 [Catalinimonas sp. 4WD22]|uniref:hypothetical protein n=1 Tax=Catalinimonas TaxID=1522128 RepID=UPI002405B6AD|nr:hypothetical protein [Catalinimonas alkaloidigena]
MNSPLALVALLLWVLLIFLVVRQCKRWAKASQHEKIFCQNHPAIPVKEYKLSEFVVHDEVEEKSKLILASKLKQPKLNPEKQVERLEMLKHSWDV